MGDSSHSPSLDFSIRDPWWWEISMATGYPIRFSVGITPLSVAVGDFNRDGSLDLAVANQLSDNVSVLLGNGDGSFQPARDFGSGIHPYPAAVVVGDFDGDGWLDLAVANYLSDDVSVLINNTRR
jgi:hypothetical protein